MKCGGRSIRPLTLMASRLISQLNPILKVRELEAEKLPNNYCPALGIQNLIKQSMDLER